VKETGSRNEGKQVEQMYLRIKEGTLCVCFEICEVPAVNCRM